MADEYIRKQDAVNMFNRAVQDVGILDADDIETVFGMLSSVDVAPVVHGTWMSDNCGFWICSNCKFSSEASAANILYKYCPNCGARMDIHGEV